MYLQEEVMPRGQGGNTPTRPIRVDLDLWARFGDAVKARGVDRSAVLRDFMAWYARDAGAKMPKRPDALYREDLGANE